MEKINKIFIADLGLYKNHLDILYNLGEKIDIINTKANIGDSKKLFTKEWIDAVSKKTAILHMLIKNNCTPIIMLDSDTIVISDFSDVIDPNYDIQVCKRAIPLLRKDGILLEYIASFFIANNAKATTFTEKWIECLTQRINSTFMPPHETPAMIDTLKNNIDVRIGLLDENVISCENNYIKGTTKVIHAKSRNKNDKVSLYRFANIKNLPYNQFICLLDNRIEKALFSILFIFKVIFPVYNFKMLIKKMLGKR